VEEQNMEMEIKQILGRYKTNKLTIPFIAYVCEITLLWKVGNPRKSDVWHG